MTKYKITKEECRKKIDDNKVCYRCGNKLSPIKTVDNSGNPTYWAGCTSCNHFNNGVKKKYFKIARKLVKNDVILPYSHMNKEEVGQEYWLEAQTGGLSTKIKLIDNMLSKYE